MLGHAPEASTLTGCPSKLGQLKGKGQLLRVDGVPESFIVTPFGTISQIIVGLDTGGVLHRKAIPLMQ